MFKILSTALLATAVSLLSAHAQMRGSISGSGGHGRSGSFRAVISASEVHGSFSGRAGMRHFYPPALLGTPYYYADYASQPVVTEAPPQFVVVEVPAPSAAVAPQEKAEPLLIEWRDGRYVRVRGSQAAEGEPPAQPDSADAAPVKPTTAAKRANHTQPPAPDLQPVELVYRDGHREQVRGYTIADGILYASGNYWTDGYWNKKIMLSALNLPATEQASEERGVKFAWPSSPNEVVVQP
jgi:hypothetical protein